MSQYPTTIFGHLTQDPEITRLSTGKLKTRLRIASSRSVRASAPEGASDKDAPEWRDTDVLFLDVEAWDQAAVNMKKSLSKGMPVIAIGQLRTNLWEDENGKHSRIVMRAMHVGIDLNRYVTASQRIDANHDIDGLSVNGSGLTFDLDYDYENGTVAKANGAAVVTDSEADARAAASNGVPEKAQAAPF